ncbi:hypothetical protein [Acinetobacter sp. Marseille-P8610]|uniref:hypothetical protein n=1 Tax=Acinetobacter sp. Marseille-P8610 TaxID=2864459 RepID=UPI001CE4A861|nr:hypothetical protein [Acinetobacter sp. Marseille-P8610]
MLHIDDEIREAEQELMHIGSCSTAGLTQEQIAQLDERFFLAIEKLAWLKGRRDIRVKEWTTTSILNSQESVNIKRSRATSLCRKRMKNI